MQVFITLWKHDEMIFTLIKVLRLGSANISKCCIIIYLTIREKLLLADVIAFCYVINVRIDSNSIFLPYSGLMSCKIYSKLKTKSTISITFGSHPDFWGTQHARKINSHIQVRFYFLLAITFD